MSEIICPKCGSGKIRLTYAKDSEYFHLECGACHHASDGTNSHESAWDIWASRGPAETTLRDQFAMATLTGLCVFDGTVDYEYGSIDGLANLAYRIADTMMKARNANKVWTFKEIDDLKAEDVGIREKRAWSDQEDEHGNQ